MCMNCAVQMGKHIYTNEVENCCVCLENKNMILLKCNHKVCFTFEDNLLKTLMFDIDNYRFYITKKLIYIYKDSDSSSMDNVFNFEFPLNLNKIYNQILNCLIFT
jgi:hypothetical protein